MYTEFFHKCFVSILKNQIPLPFQSLLLLFSFLVTSWTNSVESCVITEVSAHLASWSANDRTEISFNALHP